MLSDIKSELDSGSGIHAVISESLGFMKIERLYRFCQTIGGFMAKKNFWLGVLAMALAFGLVLSGCTSPDEEDDGTLKGDVKITNNSSYEITKIVLEAGGNDDTEFETITKDVSIKVSADETFSVKGTSTNEDNAGKSLSIKLTVTTSGKEYSKMFGLYNGGTTKIQYRGGDDFYISY
jgi:hypothetical protein